jgi:UDPglucose--hexose-1-phosphate uridylyltransferase
VSEVWEQRWHPFRGEWVLFTTHRGGRPWSGETVPPPRAPAAKYDPKCPLCPGNLRLKGRNPAYSGVYWFENDLPAFGGPTDGIGSGDGLYRARPASGTAEVVCYHPDHHRTFADLAVGEAEAVVEAWTERSKVLAARRDVLHVHIFENNGSLVGTSNPHPHSQIYAGNLVYGITAREVETSREHWERTGRCLGMDVFDRESSGSRIICRNDSFIACVPWFARYAYEVFVLPSRPVCGLKDLDDVERRRLASILLEVAIRFENLWQRPMPYIMAIHQAPVAGASHPFFPFHVEFHPPLRTPEAMKYLAGPEIGGGTMTNESNPEVKAAELRAVSSRLYRDAGEVGGCTAETNP